MGKIAIILISESCYSLALTIQKDILNSEIYSKSSLEDTISISSISECVEHLFNSVEAFIFIGAMGICVRTIAPYIKDKYTDPAVINIDSTGQYVIPVLSGHIGGANELAERITHIIGGEAIITTQGDNTGLWALDTLGKKFDWVAETPGSNMNDLITSFVNGLPVALLLDIKDKGTAYLEKNCPPHVDIYYKYENIVLDKYKILIAVTPYKYEVNIPVLYFHPKVLHLGIGCRKNCASTGVYKYMVDVLEENNFALSAIKDISTIDIKKDEELIKELSTCFGKIPVHIYTASELSDIEIPNPSEKVKQVTSVGGIAESTAIKSAGGGKLLLEKQKAGLTPDNEFTFAVAIDQTSIRGKGHIEIVGAGPGDPELISVKGKEFLEKADLILYAGSLVPIELTHYAKKEAVIRSSASLNLEEQFLLMKEYYDKGYLLVRLHTGDPCIYGAIQEQMAFFDHYQMSYHITPGISSFQAAAAALQSQFTIPEKVQTIILTRGEGRTAMPEKEKLHLLAQSQSTMCIFLSAGIVEEVQQQLLMHYPPSTPVAACYKLTWKDEKIYRGELKDLSRIIKENNLTLTTMIVVGEAIDNRQGLSRLYADEFKHLYRK
ncbi:MAG: precorrin-4 C(11)-methyltransferase [Odoribacter sp.]|nr:precorrin-4 C(11)-methyltransferase [Odoribacter sp.]